jgi:hypothetical protein
VIEQLLSFEQVFFVFGHPGNPIDIAKARMAFAASVILMSKPYVF